MSPMACLPSGLFTPRSSEVRPERGHTATRALPSRIHQPFRRGDSGVSFSDCGDIRIQGAPGIAPSGVGTAPRLDGFGRLGRADLLPPPFPPGPGGGGALRRPLAACCLPQTACCLPKRSSGRLRSRARTKTKWKRGAATARVPGREAADPGVRPASPRPPPL